MCFYHGTLEHEFKIKIKINLHPSTGSVVHGHVEPLPVGHSYGSHPYHVIRLKFEDHVLQFQEQVEEAGVADGHVWLGVPQSNKLHYQIIHNDACCFERGANLLILKTLSFVLVKLQEDIRPLPDFVPQDLEFWPV